MFAAYVLRGVKAGAVAGLFFGLFVALVANPLIGFAETFEAGHHGAGEPQTVTGLVSVLGGVLFGLLLGAVVFGVGFYFLEPGIPGTGGTKSYLLAAAGFVTVSGAPWLVLPPQPPGVEQALSVGARLGLYGLMMVVGAACCGVAGYLFNRLRGRYHRLLAAGAALAPFTVLAILAVVAPQNAAAGAIPERLAYLFRMITVFGQVALWLVLASVHGWLVSARPADDSRADVTVTGGPGAPTADS